MNSWLVVVLRWVAGTQTQKSFINPVWCLAFFPSPLSLLLTTSLLSLFFSLSHIPFNFFSFSLYYLHLYIEIL
jgi:hypothetical protein